MTRHRLAAAASGAVALAILVACGGSGDDTTSVQRIVSDPQSHYGEEVTIETTVSRQIDHRVWEMAGGRLFVIKDDSLRPIATEGERMRLTGTVRPLDKQTIEGELGIDIEDHFFTDDFLADDVVIVAETVERMSG